MSVVFSQEMTLPATITGMDGIKSEDGGQALVVYGGEKETSSDDELFVRIQSWSEADDRHALLRSLMGKRIRITIEMVDD